MIDAVAISIPVNNEERLLPECIAGVRAAVGEAARRHPDVTVAVGFALDRCTDSSAAIITAAGYHCAVSPAPGVGAARASAADSAIRMLDGFAHDRILLACTDADSVVPVDWIADLIELADRGADVIIGPVRPNDEDLDEARRAAWQLTHLDGQSAGHVHGANLGVRAHLYAAIGGFAGLDEHEDVDLVQRAMSVGAQVMNSGSFVTTSGRLRGRTDGGYAGYLREQLIPLAIGRDEVPQPVI